MQTQRQVWKRRLVCVACAATLLLVAPRARAGDLPPPVVRPSGSARPAPVAPAATTGRRAPLPLTPADPAAPTRPLPVPPRAVASGLPSEPLAVQGRGRHSTYVPPVAAPAAGAPRAAPAGTPSPRAPAREAAVAPTPPTGRVPVTTFRIASAPQPRRRTTWDPSPVPAPPAPVRAGAVPSLPAPSVRAASPSYAEIERTRARSVTSRARPDASSTHLRTLQRRAAPTPALRRSLRTTDLTVPPAPGQGAPTPPTRHVLPLRLPAGCSGDT